MLLRPLETILKTYIGDRVTIFTSKPYFLEILPPACGKGEALAFVTNRLGIGRESVMAVGDSMNDESMIRWAGWGVAMRNGDDRIKAMASFVTARTNEEDGVAELVERYILGDEALPNATAR
jgi:hydroxymethylpyrimidine pyrophosphatase-like HAD family hydrolase